MLHIKVEYQSRNIAEKSSDMANKSVEMVHESKNQAMMSAQEFIEWEKATYRETIEKSQTKIKSIKELFIMTSSHLNSLVYTVLTFIFVLVMVMIVMIQ